jgi:aspartyl-tRNA synthetase
MMEDDTNAVWAIPAKTGGSRAFCDRMNSWAQGEGQPGWATSSGARKKAWLPAPARLPRTSGRSAPKPSVSSLGLEAGDACFFVAGDPESFATFAGNARTQVGTELELVDEDRFELCWIVDFPFYEWDEENKKCRLLAQPVLHAAGRMEALEAAQAAGDEALINLKAYQYDLVCNGYEIASGSIRNQLPELMVKAFEVTGKTRTKSKSSFGGLYRAFQYGAPPHGGMAAGVDRIVMLLCGAKSVREVALFPMNQQAVDLMMGKPGLAGADARTVAARAATEGRLATSRIRTMKKPG